MHNNTHCAIIIQVYYCNHKEVTQLPNIKSSIRSVKTDAERRAKKLRCRNLQIRTATRQNGLEAVEAGAVEDD